MTYCMLQRSARSSPWKLNDKDVTVSWCLPFHPIGSTRFVSSRLLREQWREYNVSRSSLVPWNVRSVPCDWQHDQWWYYNIMMVVPAAADVSKKRDINDVINRRIFGCFTERSFDDDDHDQFEGSLSDQRTRVDVSVRSSRMDGIVYGKTMRR